MHTATQRASRPATIPEGDWNELSDDVKEEFFAQLDAELDELGIAFISGALSEETCGELRATVERELANATPIEQSFLGKPGAVQVLYDFQGRSQLALDVMAFPPVVEFCRRHLGRDMQLHSNDVRVVPPGKGGTQRFHSDGGFRAFGTVIALNAGYYLCDADIRNGSTKYIPGSHRPSEVQEMVDRVAAEGLTQEQLDEWLEQDICRHVEAKLGDVAIFDSALLHADSLNTSDADRVVMFNYYQRWVLKQQFDYPRQYRVPEIRALTPDQRTLLGFDSRVPLDVRELYMMRRSPEFDPLGHSDG